MTIGIHTPPGRPKGCPNKATRAAREAIAMFVDGNAHRLQEWLDRIAEDDPEKAFSLFQSVLEYHVPKLARNENTMEINIGEETAALLRARQRLLEIRDSNPSIEIIDAVSS